MNLSAMRTRARIYGDDRNSDIFSDSELTALINSAQESVQKVIDNEDEKYFCGVETYSVVANADSLEFELPTGCMRIRQVEKVTTGRPQPCVPVDFRLRHDSIAAVVDDVSGSTGTLFYYLRGTKLGIVAPTEAATIRCYYTKKVTDLSGDSDVSEIPLEYHDLVCLLAAQLMYGSQDRPMPVELRNRLDYEMAKIPADVQNREGQAAKTVRYVED